MTARRGIPRTYRAFEKAVVAPIHAFWLDADPAHLSQSASVLRALHEQVESHEASENMVVSFEGWLLPTGGFTLRVRQLRALNPGYRVRVQRYARPEVGQRGFRPRPGFRVKAQGKISLPPFDFRITNRAGHSQVLQTSNSDVAFATGFFPASPPAAGTEQAHGYLDSIRPVPVASNDDPRTWLAKIVHTRSAEMFDLMDSAHGGFIRNDMARLRSLFPSEGRWNDRFALSNSGIEGKFTSDFVPVRVVRPLAPPLIPSSGPIKLPLFEGKSNVLHAGLGQTALKAPSVSWLRLENARVQNGGTVFVDDALVVYEDSADPRRDFVAGQWTTIFGSQANPDAALAIVNPPAPIEIPEGILLAGRNDSNWFHWLIEYLPRVLMLGDGIADDVPLLVTARTPATGIAALRTLTSRRLVEIDDEQSQTVRILHVLPPPVQILDTTRVPWAQGLCFNPEPLRAMRKAWNIRDIDIRDIDIRDGRRVFLRRKSAHRGLMNEVEIAEIAQRYGLEILDPSDMTFETQRDLFSHSSLLVGASGAVMASYLMMPRGSAIIALTSEALADFILPAAMAQLSGASFTYVTGPTTQPLCEFDARNNWLHSDFSVDPQVFETALIAALAQLDRTESLSKDPRAG